MVDNVATFLRVECVASCYQCPENSELPTNWGLHSGRGNLMRVEMSLPVAILLLYELGIVQ